MLKIKANPTFHADVQIPAPGGVKHEITIEFKHKTKAEFDEYMQGKEAANRSEEDTILGIAVGWTGVDAPLSKESLRELFQNYHASSRVIAERYAEELFQVRQKN